MFPGAKIVAVDDDAEHLNAIVVALRSLGLACLSYHYPDERPGADTSFGGIRLLILDINLIGGNSPGNDSATLGPTTSLTARIISKQNGPYALITWSTTDLHEALIERLREMRLPEEQMPFFSSSLSKAEFLDNPESLKEAIRALLTNNARFGALLDWERRVSRAAERVLCSLGEISEQFPGVDRADKMDWTLSNLAVNAFGQANVADHRFESANEALLPILGDAISTELFSREDEDIWSRAVTKHGEKAPLTSETVSKLNTNVNLEISTDVKSHRRGAILDLPPAWLDDEEFERKFGAKPNQLRGGFLKLDLPRTPRWVLIQVQAECDFSQGHVGTIPYVLAAVVPTNSTRKRKDGVDLDVPSNVWKSPPFQKSESICETDFGLEILTGVLYPMTRRTLDEVGFKVMGRLKDQIVTAIAYHGNTHNSRPGFISFR